MRYLDKYIVRDLDKKMVFPSGPRQTRKTTLVQGILKKTSGIYLNWDDPEHKRIILNRDWEAESRVIVFDEIHKFSRLKNFVKGTFDTQKNRHKFIVTGSAKLDIYKKGQDSMMGRFLVGDYNLCVWQN